MNRRDLLAACGFVVSGSLSAAAGCLARDGTSRTDGGDDPSKSAAGGRLDVIGVETPTDAIRLNDLGTSPGVDIPTVDSLPKRERRVATSALADGYRTDADPPPDWLAAFVGETPYLRRTGDYYRLDHDLPRYTITAEESTDAAVDGRVADAETYREAVTHDGVRTTGLLRIARKEGFRLVYLWPSLRQFLDNYDAVRYRGSLLSVSVEVDEDGPPYEVTATRIPPGEVTDESVYDASEASEAVREAVRAAGETRGVYAGDLPPALLAAVADHQYVYLDGTFYWAGLENQNELPVGLEVTVPQPAVPEGGEPRVRLALVNEGDRDVSVFSGAPPPFGVLRVEAVDGDGGSLLWTDAYRESSHVRTEGKSVTFVQDIGLTTPLPAGSRIDRTFTLVGALDPGEYVLRGDVGIEFAESDGGGTLPYRVSFRVGDESEPTDS